MKISRTSIYSVLFILIVLLQLYVVSYKVSYILQLILFFILIYNQKILISTLFGKIVVLLFSMILLGFTGTLLHDYQNIDIIKDFIFISKPLISFLFVYLIAHKINDKETFIRTIIYLGIICAIIHFIILLFFVKHTSIHALRDLTKDNFIELFALFFIFGYQKLFHKPFVENKYILNATILLIVFSNVFYFSRMTIIVSFILLLCYFGFTRINRLNLSILGVITIAIFGMFWGLNQMNIKRNADGIEAFLYKVKISPQEIFKKRIDRYNHAKLWDHWRGYEANRAFALMDKSPSSYIVGTGHGSLINLKMHVPLTTDKKGLKYISHIHNGYAFVFYKLGGIGLLIYFIFLISIYLIGQIKNNFLATTISAIGIIYLLSSFTITGIFNTSENIMLILGGLIFYLNFSNDKKSQTTTP